MEKQKTTVNIRGTISADQAKVILINKERDLLAIDKKIKLLYEEMMRLEDGSELIRAAAMPGKPAGVAQSGNGGHKDNLDVLERYRKQKRERSEEIRMQLWILSEKADNIRRLWNCFMALEEPYYSILYELYIKKELYEPAQCSSGFSHRGFEQCRKEGLDLLAEMYNSDYSALELMELTKRKKKPKARPRKRKEEGCPGQMELPLDRLSETGRTTDRKKLTG